MNWLDDAKRSAAGAGRRARYKSDLSGPLWVNRFNQHGLVIPKDACWLNLIEPWWK